MRSIAALNSATRAGSSMPKTRRQITSKVIRCMTGRREIDAPSGSRSSSSSAMASIRSAQPLTCSPWKGGSSSLRWRMWSPPERKITERSPAIGLIRSAEPPRMKRSLSKSTAWMSSGAVAATKAE